MAAQVPIRRQIPPIFRTRYEKHLQDIKNSIDGIGCLQLILPTAYACVKLDRTLDIPYMKLKREAHVNVLEKYPIYSTLEQNFHLGDSGVNNVIVTSIF
jgi:hypothetical protein